MGSFHRARTLSNMFMSLLVIAVLSCLAEGRPGFFYSTGYHTHSVGYHTPYTSYYTPYLSSFFYHQPQFVHKPVVHAPAVYTYATGCNNVHGDVVPCALPTAAVHVPAPVVTIPYPAEEVAPVEETAPAEEAAPVEKAAQVEEAAQAEEATPAEEAAAPTVEAATVEEAAPAEEATTAEEATPAEEAASYEEAEESR